MRRIGEVVDLRHSPGAPARRAGDEIGNAGVAFPPALVRVVQPIDANDEMGVRRIGDVPDLVRLTAERAQQVDRRGVALGQRPAVAHAHHLRAALLVVSLQAWKVMQIFRLRRVGHVEDRGSAELRGAGQRIDRLGHGVGAAVVTDIGDEALALSMDGRLIGAARLKIVVADEPQVARFRRVSDLLHLCGCA